MEHVGFESGHIHGTVHTRANYWVNGQQRKGRLIQTTATRNFHTYATEWSPQRIDLSSWITRAISPIDAKKTIHARDGHSINLFT